MSSSSPAAADAEMRQDAFQDEGDEVRVVRRLEDISDHERVIKAWRGEINAVLAACFGLPFDQTVPVWERFIGELEAAGPDVQLAALHSDPFQVATDLCRTFLGSLTPTQERTALARYVRLFVRDES
jgi:hypothetical protein